MKISDFPETYRYVTANRPGRVSVKFSREGSWWKSEALDVDDLLADDWTILLARYDDTEPSKESQ